MRDVTIVVPLYNKGKYIFDCLESINSNIQECGNCECIIVDDGSTDASTNIASSYSTTHSDSFTYIKCLRNHKKFPSYARNLGIRLSDSKYIIFFDADDVMCDGYLKRGFEYMESNPDICLYLEAFYRVYFEDKDYFEYVEFWPFTGDYGIDNFGSTGGGVYIRGFFRKNLIGDIRYKEIPLEDSVFTADYIMKNGKYYINNSNYSFYYYECRSEQDKMVHEDGSLNDREYINNYIKSRKNG